MLFVVLAFYYRTGRAATVKTTEANCRTIPLSRSRTMKKKRKKKKIPSSLLIASFTPFPRYHACERFCGKQIISVRSALLELFRRVEKPVLYNMPLELLLDQVGNVGTEIPWFTIYILA